MGLDLPDGTKKITISYTGGFVGLEEHAARLGSIVPWDMLGNVVLMEDFEVDITEWTKATSGAASSVTWQNSRRYSGSYAVALVCDTGATDYARMSRYLYFPGVKKYGVFLRALFPTAQGILRIEYELYDGTTKYVAGIEYDQLTSTLKVYDDTGTWQTVTDSLVLGPTVAAWYPFRFLFDLADLLYDKVVIGDEEYSLSGYGVYNTPDTSALQSVIIITVAQGDATITTYIVDDVVIVENIP